MHNKQLKLTSYIVKVRNVTSHFMTVTVMDFQ